MTSEEAAQLTALHFPMDADDTAALTAARYLCASGGNLTTADGWRQALLTYNQSDAYLAKVRNNAAAYSIGRHP